MKKKIFKAILYIFLSLIILSLTFALIFRKKLLVSMGNYLVEENELKKCHAIVPLSGGFPDREIELQMP